MYQIYSGNKAKVIVNGGTFMPWDCTNGYDLCTANEGVIEIYGGTFAEDPSSQNGINYVADDYHALKISENEYQVLSVNVLNTVEALEARMAAATTENVTLFDCQSPDAVINVPATYTGTLTLRNSTIKSIQAADNAKIVIEDDVVVNAKGSGVSAVAEEEATETFDGSAITANGTLTISGTGNLTAIAADVKAAFGIGGLNVSELSISDVHIVNVTGGIVQPDFINDTKYGTSEPEGGAAIGSGYSGAEITLNNVTIDNAQGGSKAAGIGARFWTGLTIKITGSTIKNVEGGNASAGIGGSRVSDDIEPANQHVQIEITNSTINAKGGQFGAGIGSGYDTHCGGKEVNGENVAFITETICTINIDAASNITAQGGQYAAGVGTGYHVAGLAGNIQCKVNATAGESREKYTIAQAVGFGVVDHSREVKYLTTAPSITYCDDVITVPATQVSGQEDLSDYITNGVTNLYLADGEYTMPSTSADITISGTKNAKVELPFKAVSGNSNTITFVGVTIMGETNSDNWYSTLFNGAKKVIYQDCEIYNQLTTYCNSEFTRCNFYNTFKNDYSVYCYSGSEIKFDTCSFDTECSKAIKVYDEGNGGRSVYVNSCTFTTTTKNKAAVEIDSRNSTYYIYFTGNNVLKGSYEKLWNSDTGESKGTIVYINGELEFDGTATNN